MTPPSDDFHKQIRSDLSVSACGNRDWAVRIGSVTLKNPVMTASGTAGYGTELAASFDLAELGAVVVKSLAAFEWAGNPAPRLWPTASGMLNSVGLQGPGIPYWREHVLPGLLRTEATVVASIWGRTVDEYRQAAELLTDAPAGVVAIEVNLSCPNVNPGHRPDPRHGTDMFAHDPMLSAEVVAAVAGAAGRPVWAKLSPNTDRVVQVGAAVRDAGAEAVTCVNTLLGLAYDPATRAAALGGGGGGLSGPAIHPLAVRIVRDVAAALPGYPIVGVGGIATAWDATEFLLAGAVAVQVGTATFVDPRAPVRILHGLTTGGASTPRPATATARR
jgi:dihydroorotate dehydrogenase (NAD+) catalytic subunit